MKSGMIDISTGILLSCGYINYSLDSKFDKDIHVIRDDVPVDAIVFNPSLDTYSVYNGISWTTNTHGIKHINETIYSIYEIDCENKYRVFANLTVTENCAISIKNHISGTKLYLELIQNLSGGNVVTFSSLFNIEAEYFQSLGPSQKDIITFISDGTEFNEYSVAKNI
jgi:hypothetical protein